MDSYRNISERYGIGCKKAAASLFACLCLLMPVHTEAKSKVVSVETEVLDITDTSQNYSVGPDNYRFFEGTQNTIELKAFTDDTGTRYERSSVFFDIAIQRSSASEKQAIQYISTGNNLDAVGSRAQVMEEALIGFNFATGVENVFQNTGSSITNNIERVDFVFAEGITVNNADQQKAGFVVFERNANNTVTLAAITGVDASGNVTSLGETVRINTADYGTTLTTLGDYTQPIHTLTVSGPDPNVSTDYTFEFNTTQKPGGTLVSFSDLNVNVSDTIYGYAMMGGDVTEGVIAPTNISDPFYLTNTSGTPGGGDYFGGGALLIDESVDTSGMFGAQFSYWDLNGSTPGLGTTLDGTWSNSFLDTNWTRDSAGDIPTRPWFDGTTAIFQGADSSGSYDVEVDGFIRASGLDFSNTATINIVDNNANTGKISLINSSQRPDIDVASGTTVNVDVNIDGTQGFRFRGSGGELVLTAENDISGNVTVRGNNHILRLNNTSGASLANIDQITVRNGGTVAFNSDNQLSTGTNIRLRNSGVLETNGTDQVFGTLTLQSNSTSILDLGPTGAGDLNFLNSSAISWTAGSSLNILNWEGTTAGGTRSRIFFGTDHTGLTAQQLSQITFDGIAARILSTGEIVPAPEPSTIILGILMGALGVGHYISQAKRKKKAQESTELNDN